MASIDQRLIELMTAIACSIAFVSIPAGPALAQDSAFVDDRSNPPALVRSLYNAINRNEYARAWDYFGEDKPAANLEAFAAGYSQTAEVEVVTGDPVQEGAAGSVYSRIPVAIRATGDDGEKQVFAGCYTTRLANPQIQTSPFQPLHIQKGRLTPSSKPLEEALPAECGP